MNYSSFISRYRSIVVVITLLALCVTLPVAQTKTPDLQKVTLQLQWSAQTQFAGYYAAQSRGLYRSQGLDVTIKPGAIDIIPQDVLAVGGADFCVAWLPKVLVSAEKGIDFVNIAQIFQRNGMVEISFKDSSISKPADWKGKKVGTWGYGNEISLFEAMRKAGLDPYNPKDVTIVPQQADMRLFLDRKIDAAQAMTYNEYFQVLQSMNPRTHDFFKPSDLNIISMEQAGAAMPQDGIYVRQSWLDRSENQDVAVRFLRASFQGWMYCRNHPSECVDIVTKVEPTLNHGRMKWMMNEVNALIWPSPSGIGRMDQAQWNHAVQLLLSSGSLKAVPAEKAYRTDLAEKALAGIIGDVKGLRWEKP